MQQEQWLNNFDRPNPEYLASAVGQQYSARQRDVEKELSPLNERALADYNSLSPGEKVRYNLLTEEEKYLKQQISVNAATYIPFNSESSHR